MSPVPRHRPGRRRTREVLPAGQPASRSGVRHKVVANHQAGFTVWQCRTCLLTFTDPAKAAQHS